MASSGSILLVKLHHNSRPKSKRWDKWALLLLPETMIICMSLHVRMHSPLLKRSFALVWRKQPTLKFDAILHESKPEDSYAADFEQVLIQGNRVINEVAFLHKESKTLILTDSIELIGDSTPGTNWVLRCWWKYLLRMWNVPKPAPEYQMGWNDKVLAKKSMEKIMQWDFQKVIISHGENISEDAKNVVYSAWKGILG